MQSEITIRLATRKDEDAIWSLLKPVIRAGETYPLLQNLAREDGLDYWFAPDKTQYIAHIEGQPVGIYYIKPNTGGGGAIVCNCGYIADPSRAGQGIATALCRHSIETAKRAGYRAMQYNFVIATNSRAVSLWQHLGFKIVGTLPGAYEHPSAGYVDAHIMYMTLV